MDSPEFRRGWYGAVGWLLKNNECAAASRLLEALPALPPAAPQGEAVPSDQYKKFDRVCGDCGETWRGVHECPARKPAPASTAPEPRCNCDFHTDPNDCPVHRRRP